MTVSFSSHHFFDYEVWEQKIVEQLDGQPHYYLEDISDTVFPKLPMQQCHHNVETYRGLNKRAKPVLGWLQDEAGYILHSAVEIGFKICEITPIVLRLPFVRDRDLQIEWVEKSEGTIRAEITRHGRSMPPSIRTPEAARQIISWGKSTGGKQKAKGLLLRKHT